MRLLLSILLAVTLVLAPASAGAQCAMCKANVESATNDGRNENNVAGGLNDGILYLLAVPYLAAVVVGVAWYRQRRRLQRESA